jgi:hypothetical protein
MTLMAAGGISLVTAILGHGAGHQRPARIGDVRRLTREEKTGEIVEGPRAAHRRERDALERHPYEVRKQVGADPTMLSRAVTAALLAVVIINVSLPGLVLLALMLAGFDVLTYRIGTPSFPIGHLGEEQR